MKFLRALWNLPYRLLLALFCVLRVTVGLVMLAVLVIIGALVVLVIWHDTDEQE
jgi:hypothetical protein